jgi:hypothetical protein
MPVTTRVLALLGRAGDFVYRVGRVVGYPDARPIEVDAGRKGIHAVDFEDFASPIVSGDGTVTWHRIPAKPSSSMSDLASLGRFQLGDTP